MHKPTSLYFYALSPFIYVPNLDNKNMPNTCSYYTYICKHIYMWTLITPVACVSVMSEMIASLVLVLEHHN